MAGIHELQGLRIRRPIALLAGHRSHFLFGQEVRLVLDLIKNNRRGFVAW
jgi:hypothetical protein